MSVNSCDSAPLGQAFTLGVQRFNALLTPPQATALSLYRSLGFVETSEPYDDGGVMHVDMRRD